MNKVKTNLSVSWLRVFVTTIIVIGIFFIVSFLLVNIPWILEGNKLKEHEYQRRTEYMLSCFQEAIQQYTKDCGSPPTELQWLMTNPGVSGWAGPYIKVDKVFYLLHRYDGWLTPYRYEVIDDKAIIISAGPDKVFGTKDDIQK